MTVRICIGKLEKYRKYENFGTYPAGQSTDGSANTGSGSRREQKYNTGANYRSFAGRYSAVYARNDRNEYNQLREWKHQRKRCNSVGNQNPEVLPRGTVYWQFGFVQQL